MQRNSVISLRLTPAAWQRRSSQAGADPLAAYGCVDWYLYQDAPRTSADSPAETSASLIRCAAPVRDVSVVLSPSSGKASVTG